MNQPATGDDIAALSRRKWGWMSARDIGSLASVFHDDAVFVHMGATFTRQQELDVVAGGSIHYRDVDIHDISVRLFGGTAIVLGTLDLTAVVNGHEVTNPFVVTEVYVRTAAEWLLASMSFTRLITT